MHCPPIMARKTVAQCNSVNVRTTAAHRAGIFSPDWLGLAWHLTCGFVRRLVKELDLPCFGQQSGALVYVAVRS